MFDDIFNTLWNDNDCFDLINKRNRTRDLVLYMLDRTQQIFVWEGLPTTIPQHNLEYLLQVCGNACITEVADVPTGRGEVGLYAFFGGLGGMLNAYYEPTIYTVSNPYLEFNKELQIGVECVRARNDKYSQGLIPLFTKYGSMMNENEISLNMLSINYRIDNLISADDDRTYESAKEFLNNIVKGKYGAISSSEFFDGIKNEKGSASSKSIKDLIEYEQYLKASWYNEIGLNSNYNMKRERIVSAEAQLTDDALIPLVDNMLEWRLKACDEIKEMYGDKYDLDGLTVKLNSIWDLDKMYIDSIPEDTDETIIDFSERSEDEITDETDEATNETGAQDDNNGDNNISNSIMDDSNVDNLQDIEESVADLIDSIAEVIEQSTEDLEDSEEVAEDENEETS